MVMIDEHALQPSVTWLMQNDIVARRLRSFEMAQRHQAIPRNRRGAKCGRLR